MNFNRMILWLALSMLVGCSGDVGSFVGGGGGGGESRSSGPQAEVETALQAWCNTQTTGDFQAYKAMYAPTFEGIKRTHKGKVKRYDRAGWYKDRGKMFRKPLRVDCLNPRTQMGPNKTSASITFEQYWRSPTYADAGDKRVDFTKTQMGWLLVGEEMIYADKWDTRNFRDGSPAPKAVFSTNESPTDKWGKRRVSSQPNLSIPPHEGPFWIIAVGAVKSEAPAVQKVRSLRSQGYDAHTAWLGHYGSAKYKERWVIYIGPYAYHDRGMVEQMLPGIQNQVEPTAYGVTLGLEGQREKLR